MRTLRAMPVRTIAHSGRASMRRQTGGQVRRVGKVEQGLAQVFQGVDREGGNPGLLGGRHRTQAPRKTPIHSA